MLLALRFSLPGYVGKQSDSSEYLAGARMDELHLGGGHEAAAEQERKDDGKSTANSVLNGHAAVCHLSLLVYDILCPRRLPAGLSRAIKTKSLITAQLNDPDAAVWVSIYLAAAVFSAAAAAACFNFLPSALPLMFGTSLLVYACTHGCRTKPL